MSTGSNVNQTDKQLEFYIQECAEIVKLNLKTENAKELLYEVANQCSKYKSVDSMK